VDVLEIVLLELLRKVLVELLNFCRLFLLKNKIVFLLPGCRLSDPAEEGNLEGDITKTYPSDSISS
jgi:hypothetical protein